MLKSILAAALAAAALLPAGAHAQAFPSRPVRIMVPFPPGGGIDVLVRALSVELSQRLGQPVIVENRAGASGNLGADVVAKAPADGHVLLASVNQVLTSNRFLLKNAPFDPDKAFAPVTLMVQSDQYVVAHPSVPAKDFRELVAYAKREPGKVVYGSFGVGSQPQLAFETVKKREGVDLLHVPYKGVAPLITAITAGEVMLTTGSGSVAGELMRAGKLKALAIAGQRRSAQFPDVPTTAEQGFPYLQVSIWYGLFAPAGTPAAAIDRIGDEVRALLRTPAFAEKHVTGRGLEVVASGPRELARIIQDETAIVGEMIRAANVQAE